MTILPWIGFYTVGIVFAIIVLGRSGRVCPHPERAKDRDLYSGRYHHCRDCGRKQLLQPGEAMLLAVVWVPAILAALIALPFIAAYFCARAILRAAMRSR